MAEEISYVLPHDSSNALILPAKVPGKKLPATGQTKPKTILSKKKQKKLQKILERKKKRFTRVEIFEKLNKNRITEKELSLFTPVALMQQKCLKRKITETESSPNISTPNSLSGSGKKKNRIINEKSVVKNFHSGPYFETDSSSSDEFDQEPENHLKDSVPEMKPDLPANQTKEIIFDQCESLEDTKEFNRGILAVENNSIPAKSRRPTINVPVHRTAEVQENRLKLPVLAMEQEIMEQINDSQVVIICGETGSGKTTQIPQFLYEAGYCSDGRLIGVTEPRRVAAMAMSRRVAYEMNLCSDTVSYQIRYEGNVTDRTKIKFMTDGILLKELRGDFLLRNYSAIVVDEAHERSMYSDILIGLLSRVVRLRQKRNLQELKLIIMSATLRVDDFLSEKLFQRRPSLINVDARQFPVTTFFNKRTVQNYLQDAYEKCCKIHRRLPDGGILVFVSGQREVHTLVTWLSQTFPNRRRDEMDPDETLSRKKRVGKSSKTRKVVKESKKISLDSYKIEQLDVNDADAADFEILNDADEDNGQDFSSPTNPVSDRFDDSPIYCLPLYSLLSSEKQVKVFQPPPDGHRLCVVATNVAETSLTIPNVKYVIDTGKEKVRAYDGVTGVSKFVVRWISKASAEQRTGRAGRTSPGKCYRLYSSAVFNEFRQFSEPEIVQKPIDDVVLLMKNMNILKVSNFPFPTSPDVDSLIAAERRLIRLGALAKDKSEDQAKITLLGRTMALFPVSPSYAKMLSLAHQQNLLPYVICLVAALSVREPLVNLTSLNVDETDEKTNANISNHLRIRREWAGKGEFSLFGDLQVLLRAVLEWEKNNCTTKFCQENGLRPKAMMEIRKMRRQLTKIVAGVYPNEEIFDSTSLPAPSLEQSMMLRQIFLAGLAENVARKRLDLQASREKNDKNSYECSSKMKDFVFIHPTSVLRRRLQDFVVYNEIIDSSKKFMFNVSAIDSQWLPIVADAYCNFGAPLKQPEPWYDSQSDTVFCRCTCTYGDAGWNLGEVTRRHPEDLDYYRRFAVAFLNGLVATSTKKWCQLFLSSPSTMLRSWSNLHRRTENLLQALCSKKINSKSRLVYVWTNEDKNFLLQEFCQWLPESVHDDVKLNWPPIN